jgi:CubicO group peptidase (beta-lactamase class C family)
LSGQIERVDKEEIEVRGFASAAILIILLLLITGCGPAAPSATAVPTSPPATQPPTPTAVPPTESPLPPTATQAESTPTQEPTAIPPTPTPASEAVANQLIDTIAGLGAAGEFGGAALVALDGEPVFVDAYGLARRDPELANQIDTKFDLGSMGKMFTSVAILQLVEQGALSLDGRIVDYWPDYPNQEVAEQVTIHHLLTHTAGMGDCFEDEFFTTPRDQLRTLEGYLPLFVDDTLQFKPGEQWAYSNEGYIVLGLIIERVTGQSYWDYAGENVLLPAGMANTGAYDLEAEVPYRATGYTTFDAEGNDTGTLAENTPLMPVVGTSAGGSYSTVEDLLRFTNALLDHRLLSPESTELLLEGKVEVREGRHYAYGVFDRMIRGQRVVGHGGGAPGVCTFMDMFPDTGYTVIVLSNTDLGCLPVLEFLGEHPFIP